MPEPQPSVLFSRYDVCGTGRRAPQLGAHVLRERYMYYMYYSMLGVHFYLWCRRRRGGGGTGAGGGLSGPPALGWNLLVFIRDTGF